MLINAIVAKKYTKLRFLQFTLASTCKKKFLVERPCLEQFETISTNFCSYLIDASACNVRNFEMY